MNKPILLFVFLLCCEIPAQADQVCYYEEIKDYFFDKQALIWKFYRRYESIPKEDLFGPPTPFDYDFIKDCRDTCTTQDYCAGVYFQVPYNDQFDPEPECVMVQRNVINDYEQKRLRIDENKKRVFKKVNCQERIVSSKYEYLEKGWLASGQTLEIYLVFGLDGCEWRCDQDERCAGFNYYENGLEKLCYVMDSCVKKYKPRAGYSLTGYVRKVCHEAEFVQLGQHMVHSNVWGTYLDTGGIYNGYFDTIEKCAERCEREKIGYQHACYGFDYNRNDTKCILQYKKAKYGYDGENNKFSGFRRKSGCLHVPKFCYRWPYGRNNPNFRLVRTTLNTPATCSHECECRGYGAFGVYEEGCYCAISIDHLLNVISNRIYTVESCTSDLRPIICPGTDNESCGLRERSGYRRYMGVYRIICPSGADYCQPK